VALAILASVVCVLLCVAVHLALLLSVYRVLSSRIHTLHQATVGVIVLVAILGHLVEIGLFGVGYAILAPADGAVGADLLYHSAAAYTSLGDSQAAPAEWRLMTAIEALAGLVLITWTASFTFLVMQKNWAHHESVGALAAPREASRMPARPAEATAVTAERFRRGPGICV
jgi:hypothetical protein